MDFVTRPSPPPMKVSSGPLDGLGLSLLNEMKPNELRDLSDPSQLTIPGCPSSRLLQGTMLVVGNWPWWEY